jgi:hypothetical protein
MRLFICAFLLVGISSSSSIAATYSTTPVIDGTRYRSGFPFPTFVFDSSTASLKASFTQSASSGLRVFISEYFFAMEFALPSLPPGFIVKNATLSWIEQADFLRPGNEHPLLGYSGNGSLGAGDFFNGVALLTTVSNGVNAGPISFDVTSFVGGLILNGDSYAGFSVQNAGYYQTQSGTFPFVSTFTEVATYQIAGRLDANPANRPMLVITSVPEAHSGILVSFVMLIVGLSVRGRLHRIMLRQAAPA